MGRPLFDISNSNLLAEVGDEINIAVELIDMVIENPEVTYMWRQVAGTPVDIHKYSDSISFTVPSAAKSETLKFEFVGSNGERDSNVLVAEVFVEGEESGSGGGSLAWYLLMLMSLRLITRVIK